MKNNMNYKLTFGLIALAISIGSCNKFVDLQPISQISKENFWKTNADARSGVASIYDGMQTAYKTKFYSWGEIRSDNFIATDRVSNDNLEMLTNNMQPSNSVSDWGELYVMINRANQAINSIPLIQGYDVNLLAEAHALRAYAYFDAVRVWGKAPVYTQSITGLGPEAYVAQTDGAKIMTDLVLPDILKAEELMITPANSFQFSKFSIYALQANIYYYLKDYAKAKIALDKFETLNTLNKSYTLVTTRQAWVEMFLSDDVLGHFENGTETVLSLKYDLVEDGGQSGARLLFFAGVPSFYVSPLLHNKWLSVFPTDEASWTAKYPLSPPIAKNPDGTPLYGDWRYIECMETNKIIGETRLTKYQKLSTTANLDQTDIHIFRYSGVLLQKALIENKLGNKQAAIDLVNRIRIARQLPQVRAVDFTSVEQLENFILDERQFELVGEGQRWWDLINTGKAVSVMNPINGQTADKLLFPVYFRHLLDNTKLNQTNGYPN